MIADKIRDLIKVALQSLKIEGGEFVVEHPTDLKMGDYSTNVAIKYGHKEEILDFLNKNKPKEVERLELAGPGFINFYLTKEFFKGSIGEVIDKGGDFGKSEHAKGFKVMVEHTQPNPFKEFHIGHLMNNTIGESISRILKANRAEVKTATYHGDIGLHVAKAMWFLLKNNSEPTIETMAEAYVEGSKAYEKSEESKKEIIELNKKIYTRINVKINDLYDAGKKISFKHFESIYLRLNSHFDYYFFETEAGGIGKMLVEENIPKVFEESDGAVIFRGENFIPKTHTRVFLNRDKLPTYEAKEIGLAKFKKDIGIRDGFNYDKSITITANEQDSFFGVVEVAIGEVFPELKGKLMHLSHGMLRLPSGKMSSRTGDVITAEALIEMVKEKVKGDEQVAIGAIKYMILRQAIGNDIIFDIEKSVSTEGDSGVYLQYAYARTNSLLEKAISEGPPLEYQGLPLIQRETHEVEKLLYRFPEIVERAGKEYAPNYITTYLTELASAFNNFYAHEQIIDDSPESPYRLAITKAFNIVMKNGLDILGIPTPERL